MLTLLKYGERCPMPVVLVLGGFDGLHRGHRALLAEAKRAGLPVAVTALTGRGKVLFTLPEREFLFERAGVSVCCELPFTEEFRNTPPEEFLKALFSGFEAKAVLCGADFRFGKGAAGTPALLEALAPCPVFVRGIVKERMEGGRPRKISASACRKHLARGEIARLNAQLCAPGDDFYSCAYFVQGTVEHGREVGRTYGFPTLNLSAPEEKLLPPDGVYGGLAATPKGNFPTIINFGARPTFGVGERKIEAHLIGFQGDLYGATVRLYPTEFLRPIEKFSSPEALRIQLEKDRERLMHI